MTDMVCSREQYAIQIKKKTWARNTAFRSEASDLELGALLLAVLVLPGLF